MAINSLYLIQVETTVKAEPNIRIRIRGAIIRIQIAEPSIRTIIRIRTEQSTPGDRHRVYFYFIFSILIFSEMLWKFSVLCSQVEAVPNRTPNFPYLIF